MEVKTHHFKSAAIQALLDSDLQAAMKKAESGFVDKRTDSIVGLTNFETFREYADAIKRHTLSNLDQYLTEFEQNVIASGGVVHWARNAEEANSIIIDICHKADAKRITKGKSMVSEEIGLNACLEEEEFQVVETDLGEYILQLADDTPSHIVAPAVHKSKQQVTDLFHDHHQSLGFQHKVVDHESIVDQARQVLREHFVNADVGITGGNFLVAETGSVVLVTNEGNGDLTATLPDVHIVTTSIEKVIPNLESLSGLLMLLGRSATGQEMSVYTSLFQGPKRNNDLDGPGEFHVVLLDNGRSDMLFSQYHEMLKCIRCAACMNHCPVYSSIGGHAYGWVYPGPMGSVLTPLLVGQGVAKDLPNACTLNGRCQTVCPVKIPLPDLIKEHRNALHQKGLQSRLEKIILSCWSKLTLRPRLYAFVTQVMTKLIRCMSLKGQFQILPLSNCWSKTRDLPPMPSSTFQEQWKSQK